MGLNGLEVKEAVDLDGIILRSPTRTELLSAFNHSYSEGPDRAVLSCGAVLAAREYVPIGSMPALPSHFPGLLWAIQFWNQRAIIDFATMQHSGWQRSVDSSRRKANLYHWMIPLPVLERTNEFKGFWQQTGAVLREPPTSLGVALRRLSVMINQERREDRILDICIILEALFQHKDDENQELSYRLSLRTAHFVGTDQASRIAVWRRFVLVIDFVQKSLMGIQQVTRVVGQ